MRKDVGESVIKVGTNLASIGAAGAMLFGDDVTVVHGIIAVLFGLIVVAIGVVIRDWRKS